MPTEEPQAHLLDEPTRTFQQLDPSGRNIELWSWIQHGESDTRLLWSSCPRGDWLAWWLAIADLPPPSLTLACCECLRMAEVGLPLSIDAPRRFLSSAISWSDQRSLEPCLLAVQECTLLSNETDLPTNIRTLARAITHLAQSLPSDGATYSPHRQFHLALWYAAAALASEVTPGEPPDSAWWSRCQSAALSRFADVLRGICPVFF